MRRRNLSVRRSPTPIGTPFLATSRRTSKKTSRDNTKASPQVRLLFYGLILLSLLVYFVVG